MEHTKADFYSGFEGEEEIIFTVGGPSGGSINVWTGYLSGVFGAIPPGPQGMWEGLLLDYHLITGCWGDGVERAVDDVPLFAAQLAAIDASGFEPETRRFYEALQALVRQALADGRELRISCF